MCVVWPISRFLQVISDSKKENLLRAGLMNHSAYACECFEWQGGRQCVCVLKK